MATGKLLNKFAQHWHAENMIELGCDLHLPSSIVACLSIYYTSSCYMLHPYRAPPMVVRSGLVTASCITKALPPMMILLWSPSVTYGLPCYCVRNFCEFAPCSFVQRSVIWSAATEIYWVAAACGSARPNTRRIFVTVMSQDSEAWSASIFIACLVGLMPRRALTVI